MTIKFNMNLPAAPPQRKVALDKFIEVYGNRHKFYHFIAMRFKRTIITYKPNALDTVPITPPPNSIVVIRGKCPPINLTNPNFLLFTDDLTLQGITVTHTSVNSLLRMLFGHSDKILFSYFKSNVLYLVAKVNPFAGIMQKCRKEVSFKTLCSLFDARINKRPLTLHEVSNLRFFKRNLQGLQHFNKWSSFAFELCYESFLQTTFSHPSAYFGREVFLILKRSEQTPGPLPPLDFYNCEILLTDSEPVGIAFAMPENSDQDCVYVSPMIVSKPKESFRDTSSVICNMWLPLYQNPETWKTFGLKEYVFGLHCKKRRLKQIVLWIQIQTSQKYQLIYQDLSQIVKILYGDDAKHILREEPQIIKESNPVEIVELDL